MKDFRTTPSPSPQPSLDAFLSSRRHQQPNEREDTAAAADATDDATSKLRIAATLDAALEYRDPLSSRTAPIGVQDDPLLRLLQSRPTATGTTTNTTLVPPTTFEAPSSPSPSASPWALLVHPIPRQAPAPMPMTTTLTTMEPYAPTMLGMHQQQEARATTAASTTRRLREDIRARRRRAVLLLQRQQQYQRAGTT